jgi:glycosyltransferase involved in cell wall biosynthesis
MPFAVTMVVPTRNRAHTLSLVAESWYTQSLVNEIIFVDDAGEDDTPELIKIFTEHYPLVNTVIVRNPKRLGAAQSRNIGVAVARNSYVLFCDDDEYLEDSYAEICLQKLLATGASAISGRRVYMRNGETPEAALQRFGSGFRAKPPFLPLLCEHVAGARVIGDIEVPFTNAIILTPTELVRQYGFDPYYSQGNGYREESDYQMNLFVNGKTIIMTPDRHSIHLSSDQCRTGGQRASRWARVRWSIYYTAYFYQKYWFRYARRIGIRMPRVIALTFFATFAVYREFLRPYLYRLMLMLSKFSASLRSYTT